MLPSSRNLRSSRGRPKTTSRKRPATAKRTLGLRPEVKAADSTVHSTVDKENLFDLECYIGRKDFVGLLTVAQWQLRHSTQLADSDVSDAKRREWIAWAHFHMSEFEEALAIYEALLRDCNARVDDFAEMTESELRTQLSVLQMNAALCNFQLGFFEESMEHASKSQSPLCVPLRAHCCDAMCQKKEANHLAKQLTDGSTEERLSNAALLFGRKEYGKAYEVYKSEWTRIRAEHSDCGALQFCLALCLNHLSQFTHSNAVIESYLKNEPLSLSAANLKMCNDFGIGVVTDEFKEIVEAVNADTEDSARNPLFDVWKHNLVCVGDCSKAPKVFPALALPKARSNLATYYLRDGDCAKAYECTEESTSAAASSMVASVSDDASAHHFVLRATVAYEMGKQRANDEERVSDWDYAARLFQAVGASHAEKDTICGRKAMASFHILKQQFAKALMYLESIKGKTSAMDTLNADAYAMNCALCYFHNGDFTKCESAMDALSDLKQLSGAVLFDAIALKTRCLVENSRPWEAWELYLETSDRLQAEECQFLLQAMADVSYDNGHFYHALKAFHALELATGESQWSAKRGAACGVLQAVANGDEMDTHLLEAMHLISAEGNPQASFLLRVMREVCRNRGIAQY